MVELMDFNNFLSFKKIVILLLAVSILLVGCGESSWNTPPDASGENGGDGGGLSDDETPPAPPEDNEGGESISDEGIPLPPDDDGDNDELPAFPDDEAFIDENKAITTSSSANSELIGLWRAFSSRLFYDAGGGGAVGSDTGHPLEINDDGSWQLSTSSGKWRIESIQESDWKVWGIDAYGPSRKMVLDNWNGKTATGPVEESNGKVDFFWVIYRAEPPIVSAPGQVQAKYGRAD